MSARIVRSGSGTPLAAAAHSFIPSARVVSAAKWDARIEAARALRDAHDEAASVRSRAEDEGFAAGRAKANAAAAATLILAQAERNTIVERSTDVVVAATTVVAERALSRALATDDASLASWAREAIAGLKAASRIVVCASPTTIERLSARISEVAPSSETAIDLVADEGMPDRSLRAQCALGDVNVILEMQVDDLVEALRSTIATAVGARNV